MKTAMRIPTSLVVPGTFDLLSVILREGTRYTRTRCALDVTVAALPCESSSRLVSQMRGLFSLTHNLEVAEETQNFFAGVLDSVEEMVQRLSDNAATAASHIGAGLQGIGQMSSVVMLGLLLVAIALCGDKIPSGVKLAGAMLLVFKYLIPASISKQVSEYAQILMNYVARRRNGVNLIQQADTFIEPSLVEAGVKMLYTLVHGYTVCSAPSQKQLGVFLNKIENMPKMTKGIQETVDVLLGVIQNCITAINQQFSTDFKFLSTGHEEVDSYVDEVKKFDKKTINYEAAEKMHRLVQQGKLLLTKYHTMPAIHAEINVAHAEMLKVQYQFSQANLSGEAMRPVPWTCMFSGASGVGKSTATYMFLTSLMDIVLPDDKHAEFQKYPNNFIHNRCTENVFWDTYTGQFCTVFDDFGQAIDQPGSGDNEYMNIIRASNNFPYPLHMAALQSKGNSYFTSSVIMCTSNLKTIDANSIVCNEAVARRFHSWAYVCPKVEFCLPGTTDGPISQRRLNKEMLVGEAFRSDIYEFHIANVKNKTGGKGQPYVATEILDWDQMLDRAATQYFQLKKEFKSYNEILNSPQRPSMVKRNNVRYAQLRSQMNDGDTRNAAQIQFIRSLQQAREITQSDPQYLIDYERSNAYQEAMHKMRENDCQFLTPTFIMRAIPGSFAGCETVGETHEVMMNLVCSRKILKTIKTMIIDIPHHQVDIDDGIVDWEELGRRLKAAKESVKEFFAARPLLKHIGVLGLIVSGCAAAATIFSLFMKNGKEEDENEEVTEAVVKQIITADPHDGEGAVISRMAAEGDLYYKNRKKQPIAAHVMYKPHAEGELYEKRKGKVQPHKLYMENASLTSTVEAKPPSYVPPHRRGAIKPPTRKQRSVPKEGLEYNAQFVNLRGVELDDQAAKDTMGASIALKIVRNNMYSLEREGKHLGYVLFIRNHSFVMPTHYCRYFEKEIKRGTLSADDCVQFRSAHKGVCYDIPVSILRKGVEVRQLSENDVAAFNAPNSVMLHPDITKFFFPLNEVPKNNGFTGIIDVPMRGEFGLQSYVTPIAHQTRLVINEGTDDEYVVRTGFTYKAQTEKGDCGAVLRVVTHKPCARIIGIHTAGDPSTAVGASSALTREMVEEMLAKLDPKGLKSQMEEMWRPVVAEPIVEGLQLTPLYWGEYDPPRNENTSISPSVLQNSWGKTKYMPAQLGPFEVDGKTIYPYNISLGVYGGGVKQLDQEIIDACRDDYYRVFAAATHGRGRGIYSFEDAVKGQEAVQFCDGIPRGTSPGYPYNAMGVHDGKKKFFGSDGEYTFDSDWCQALKKDVETVLERARKGIRSEHIFYDFPKDERRKIPKAMAGKTRMVSGCPLILTIATRMLFLDFTMAMMETRIENGVAIGTNVYSTDWDHLSKKLQTFGPNVFAGDFTGFDGSETPQCHMAMVEIINRWYNDSEENQIARRVLWLDMLNAKHITPRGQIYQTTHSLPSGHPLTTIINSMYNHIAFRYCWVLAHDGNVSSVRDFTNHVYLIAYGDDNVLNVSPQKAGIFNQQVCIEKMAEIGLTYTSETKEDTHLVPKFRTLDAVTFLKREFKWSPEDGRYIAPLELDVIKEIPYWTKKHDEDLMITKGNLENAVRELSLHGTEEWDKWFPIFEKAGRGIGYYPAFYDQQQQRDIVLADVFGY